MSPDVAFFLPELEAGGAQRVVLTLCQEFLRRGVRTELVLARPSGALMNEVPAGMTVVELSNATSGGALLAFVAIRRLTRYLRERQPAVLISSITGANLAAVVANRAARVPCRLFLRETSTFENMRQSPYRLAARMLYPMANGVIAVSRGVAEDAVKYCGVSDRAVIVINNPVDRAYAVDMASGTTPHPWLANPSPPLILGVGRLVRAKEFSTLIRAFAMLRQEIDARLMILGEGPERSHLEDLVRVLGISEEVMLPGYIANPYPYIRHASVLALSSRWEGFPNVLLQAMALDTPVVATDCRSGPAEILESGRHGRLVPVGDVGAFARALRETLRRGRSTSVRDVVMKRFDVETIARQYLDVIGL